MELKKFKADLLSLCNKHNLVLYEAELIDNSVRDINFNKIKLCSTIELLEQVEFTDININLKITDEVIL